MLPLDKKVNLLIIGAQKDGTTSLFHYLEQHPEICFSDIKEVTYFYYDEFYSKGEKYFHSFFSDYQDKPVVVSSFVHMISSSKCPERVKQYNPHMKFVIMLREPVSRAYSAYHYAKLRGHEAHPSFKEALLFEQKHHQAGKPLKDPDIAYVDNSLYHKHITHWMQYFDASQFLLVKSDDLKNDTDATLSRILTFVGADATHKSDTSKAYNKAGVPRSSMVRNLIQSKGLKKVMSKVIPSQKVKIMIRKKLLTKVWNANVKPVSVTPISTDERAFASEFFTEDLKQLQQQFGIDFNKNRPMGNAATQHKTPNATNQQ